MNLRETLGRRLLLLDGATGTQLQARGLGSGQTPELWNIERREDMIAIHHSYYAAGADLVLSNTFGVNRLKLRNCPYSVDELVAAALENLRAARDQAGHGWLGVDIGPTGHLMAPMGDLDFDEAVASFSETIRAGAAAGADAVVIETMTDLYELKAAVLAARESCHLPVLATAAFGENGRLLTGGDAAALVSLLEALGVDALGLNCGAGPLQLSAPVRQLVHLSSVPVIFKPNAGLPHTAEGGSVRYDIDVDTFAAAVAEAAQEGVAVVGGCCGTTPEHIAKLHAACAGLSPVPPFSKQTIYLSSGAQAVDARALDLASLAPIAVPDSLDDLLDEVFDRQDEEVPVLRLDFSQSSLPPLDAVEAVQEISRLPLWLEGADAGILSGALRRVNGKAMVTVPGKDRETLALLHRYGGVAYDPDSGTLTDCRRPRSSL